jgi:hypothetical protein
MGDTATTVTEKDGATVKTIDADTAREDYVDALTNMLHVCDGDELALGEFVYEAMKSARNHYRAEVAGEDGVVVVVGEVADE